MNMARNVAVDGHPGRGVLARDVALRRSACGVLCAEAKVPWDRIRNKRVGPQDWTNIVHAAEVLHDAPLHIVDSGNVNIVDIRAKARRMRTSKGGPAHDHRRLPPADDEPQRARAPTTASRRSPRSAGA